MFNPGDVFLYHPTDGDPAVFNLATQEGYHRSRAKYEWIEQALTEMRRLADQAGITTIAMPRIGAGLGGLSWNNVSDVIDRGLADWPGTAHVYDTYVPEINPPNPESPDHTIPTAT